MVVKRFPIFLESSRRSGMPEPTVRCFLATSRDDGLRAGRLRAWWQGWASDLGAAARRPGPRRRTSDLPPTAGTSDDVVQARDGALACDCPDESDQGN
jgi:hypothetical protein